LPAALRLPKPYNQPIMRIKQRPLKIDPATLGGQEAREVQIGAYARRQRRKRLAIGLAGVALIAAGWWLYLELRPKPAGVRTATTVVVRCTSCAWEGRLTVPADQRFPMDCPQCGQRACEVLWRCRDCGERFVPPRGADPLRCPRCESLRVGALEPDGN